MLDCAYLFRHHNSFSPIHSRSLFFVCRSESNAPKTNKRFLTSIIRSTDDHNKTILRAQALSALEIKREREEQERRDRRARAEEAVTAERLRRLMGSAGKRREGDNIRRPYRENGDGRRKRKGRSWEDDVGWEDDGKWLKNDKLDSRQRRALGDDDIRLRRHSGDRSSAGDRSRERDERGVSDERRRRRRRRRESREDDVSVSLPSRKRDRSRSVSSTRERARSADREQDDRRSGRRRHRTRHRSRRSMSPSDSTKRRDRSPRTPSRKKDAKEASSKQGDAPSVSASGSKANHKAKSRYNPKDPSPTPSPLSPHPNRGESSSSRTPLNLASTSRSPSPQPALPPARLPSKMDKYFEESYDPRFDVAPLSVPKVPATGLIDNADFEGWDAMLELIRLRREDKEEKRRMARLGLGNETSSSAKKKGSALDVNDGRPGSGVSIMEIEYKKRGTVREWDVGKQGV
jgi:hypothetical protein